MKADFDNGKFVKDNETYKVIDITTLNGLIVSKTVLHPKKETGGHKHAGQEEVYQFVHGNGLTDEQIAHLKKEGLKMKEEHL